MKKTILLSLLAMVLGITYVAAQARTFDLETHLVTPSGTDTIELGKPFDIVYYFKNLGPDPIMKGDTLAVQFSGISDPLGFIFGKTLNVNDTVMGAINITVGSAISSPFNFCFAGLVFTLIHTDADPTNNEECNYVYVKTATNSVAELVNETTLVSVVETYPNPANDLVRFDYKIKESGNVALTITDMSGRKVIHADLGKKNAGDDQISADVSGLVPGLYFVEINETNAKGRGRILIQR